MPDETLSEPLPLPRPRRSLSALLLVGLLAFVLGCVLVGWLAHSGRLGFILPAAKSATARLAAEALARPAARTPVAPDTSLGGVETRLALLEERLSRISGDATAASSNASRAEALLIAYAARRRIDQGEPLGFIEDQLKLRFGGAQPKAVETIIASARLPITLDELNAQLDAAAPALAGRASDESTLTRWRREFASLFVVHRAAAPAASPQDRIAQVRLMLASGRIEQAITEVERLPGADDAQAWLEAARRYQQTQHALDVIETAAMLEPRSLRDGEGKPVERPSPLAPPADAAPGTVE